MPFEHCGHLADDLVHAGQVGIAQADGFEYSAIVHARRIFHDDAGEDRVRYVNRARLEVTDHGDTPADLFDRALDIAIRRANPVADHERTVQVDDQRTEEIGKNILGRKTDRDAADTAHREHPGNAETECLQDHQHGGDDDRESYQFADRLGGMLVHRVGALGVFILGAAHESEHEPGQADQYSDVTHRIRVGKNRAFGLRVDNIDRDIETDQPDYPGQRAHDRPQHDIVPAGRCTPGATNDPGQQVLREITGKSRRQYDQENLHAPNPVLIQAGNPVKQFSHESNKSPLSASPSRWLNSFN